MENNLTMEQLQHYPKGKNGVKVKLNDDGLRELWDLDQDNSHLQGVFYIKSIDYDLQVCQLVNVENEDYGVDEADIDWLLPIFLPIDCLTKEIEVDGEKFVPILKLYQKSNGFSEFDKIISMNDWNGRYGVFSVRVFRGSHTYDFKYNSKNQNFEAFTNTNQLELFQQLFKWNFDVFGLIEKGKATNINTIK